VLWIHGWGMSSQVWGNASVLLPGVKHHFFTYADCDTIESFHTALSNKLIRTGPSISWTLIGWSLGGMLAIEQWMRWQKKPAAYSLRSIIIVSGSLRFVNENRSLGWPERVMERMQKHLKQNPQETLKQFALSMFSESDILTDTIRACIQETDFTSAGLEAGLTYLRNTDLKADWNELYKLLTSTQLLWLHGAEDPICPFAGVPSLNPNELCVFPHAGHVPFLAAPELFYSRVRSFLHADLFHDAQ
jgi:pimeloyl-[acyl-carrier protein] methyl ester esterase